MNQVARLQTIIAAAPLRLHVLHLVRALNLPDCWVAAGFVRSAVWDHLHQFRCSNQPADIDVIWFDTQAQKKMDRSLESDLRRVDSTLNWSVKNQARMHIHNGDQPYASASEAMMHWPETATAVAVRLNAEGIIEVAAPFDLNDLFNLIVRPTPRFMHEKRQAFLHRVRTKQWLETWPQLRLL